MSERLTHRRTTAAASTPGMRLIELQIALSSAEQKLVEAEAKIARLEHDHDIYHRVNDVSFGGIPAAQMRCDFWLWEYILNDNPQLQAIFELGTWFGGMAWWLWAQCQVRELHFETYDMVRSEHRKPPMYMKLDVFADRDDIGQAIRAYEPCVVFCDNGNKPREMREYSREIRSAESLLVVHDWNVEFMPSDIPDGVVEVYGNLCDELGSLTRVFRLRASDEQ